MAGLPLFGWSAEDDGRDAGFFGGENEASGGCHGQAGQLAEHRGQAGMAQGLFHEKEDGFLVRCAGMQDAVGVEAGAGQAGRKDVVVAGAPENRAVGARQDACGKEGGGCGTGVAIAGDFVQGGPGQAIFWQMVVDFRHAEGERSRGTWAETLQGADAGTQRLYGCRG